MDKEDLKYIEAGILGCSESELTEDLSQEVDSEGNPLTKEQVEFFRNSKIRDNRGRLLVCYHGSKSHFTTFDKSKIKNGGWYGKGFYFTRSQEIADYYSEGYILTCYLNMINPFYADSSFTSKEEYHNRCNKLCELIGLTMEEIDKRDEECKYIGDPYYKVLLYLEHTKSTKDINDYVKELGYDGVIGLSPEDDSLEEFIILEPNQVKSIDNKNPSNSDNINEELLYHGQDDDDMYDRENTLTWYTTSEQYAKQYGQKIFTKDIDLSKYNLLYLGEINDEVFDNDGNYTKEFKQFCKKIEMTPKQLEKYLKQFGWYTKYLNFIFDITSEYPFYRLLIDLGYDGVKAKEGGYDTYGLIKSDLTEDLFSKDKAQQDYEQSYKDLIDNDKTRLYRYREWANNSNNDYKEYIYNDLLNGKKEDALHFWYNHYKLFTGDYDLSYDDFLNTPITLYRATNVDEKDSVSNPFFSYAESKKLAQRFLDPSQRLHNKRTGEIEELQIKPKDTLGMIPSDEYEIIVPSKAYQSRVNDMSSIVDNVLKYANDNNVKLPYDRDYILTLFNKRDKENVKKLEAHLMNYIDKRKGNKIKESVDSKTFTFPNLRQAIDFFWKDRNVKIETVPIKKLVDDNDLLNDWDLQSYHQRQWDNKKASEFSIDKSKVNSMRISEVPYAVRKKDGKLELGDGRHRTRALYNDGYEYVTLPVITESKLNENKSKKHKYFAVSENDSEYYDTKANALKDLVNFGKDVEVVLYSLKNVEDIDELSSEDELGHYINGKLVKPKTTLKTTPKIKESLLQEGKQDIENFKKWIENNEDSNAQLMSAGNKDAFVNNWAAEFNNIRQNLKSPYNDFYYWIKLNDWDAFTKFMQEQRNKKDAKQREKDGARLIYSDNDWKVYEITTYEASVKYGANTKWCISGSKRWSNGENGKGYWDDYTSKGVKFYFFISKDTKYAIAIYPNGTDFEIFDAQDNSIAYIPNAPIIDEIKVDYYSQNEDRLMLNLVKTGQLPHICALLSSYLWKNDWDVDIYAKSEFDDFLHQLGEYINPDYVKWLAVYNGLKDEEWYEEETGEEYDDEWGGDTTYYLQNDLGFLDNYASLEDALTKDNPYFNYDNNEYFISDLYDCDIVCCKDWVGVWIHIARYIEDETELINFIKRAIKSNGYYEDFEKVGLSKEYLLDIDDDYYEEDLDESLDEVDDEVGVVYHGGIEKSLHKDFKSILWFTEDYDYALDFGENIFICNLNLKNTFIVGDTDGYIRGLIPTQFSMDFTRLANNLRVTPKELLKCNPDAKNIYSIVRTKAFKELCSKNGYDSVETEEFGHVCFGVFNLDQVDIVDTDFEDESTLETLSPMDESLTPNLRDIK